MNRDDIQKLLGGYATGTLTPEEQEALFAAALEDQELFDALAREQSLRDLLRDPAARAHALAALEPKPAWWSRWWRPAVVGLAMASVSALVVVSLRPKPQAVKPELIASVREERQAAPAPAATFADKVTDERSKTAPERKPEQEKRALFRQTPAPSGVKELDSLADGKELSAGRRDAPAGGGGGGGRGGAAGAVSSPVAAPPPASPPAVAEPKPALSKVEAAAETVTVLADVEMLKSRAAAETGARELFFQKVGVANQLMGQSKDASNFAQNAQQPEANSQQNASQARMNQQAIAPAQSAKKAVYTGAQNLRAAIDNSNVGVRYTIIPAGDAASLRLEANEAGHLSVWARRDYGEWRLALSAVGLAMTAHTVTLRSGEKEVAVWFSRVTQLSTPAVPPPSGRVRLEGPRGGDAATYAVNPSAGANEVRFNITVH